MRKTSILIIALFFASYVHAQDTTLFNITFNHFSRSVKNVDRSVGFYQKVLMLKEIPDGSQTPGTHWLSLGEGKALHLISTIRGPFIENEGIHLGLSTPNFDAFVKHLDSLKVTWYNWDGALKKINVRADGIKQVYFKDPDGYWIEVNDAVEK